MKINQLKAGVIISYATEGVNILTGLLYTPVMLRLLGQSEYGLYQLVYSVVAYLNLLGMGFGSGYVRFYSRYNAAEDEVGIARLNGMFLLIFTIISLICIGCGGILTFNAEVVFGSGLTSAELYKSKILMGLLVFNMAVTFLNSVFKCYITANERFLFQRLLNFLKTLFNPFISLVVLIMGYGSVGMVIVSTALTVIVFVTDLIYCKKKLEMEFIFKDFKFSLLKEMWVFTFFIFVNIIVDQINWNIAKFLLGRYIGTIAVAVYGVAGQLNSMYIMFSTAVSSVFIPKVNKIVAKQQSDNILTNLFVKVGRIQYLIIGLIISGYIVYGREFIHYWAGTGYEDVYVIGLFLMLPVTIPLIQNLGIEIQRAKNMHKARSLVYLFIAVCNIFVSIPLIKVWGAKGAACGTAISLILGNGIFMNIYYHKKINLDIVYFWKKILPLIPPTILSGAIGYLVKYFIVPHNEIMLATNIVLYCVVYCVFIWFIGMNKEEKNLIIKPLKKIGAKLCKQ